MTAKAKIKVIKKGEVAKTQKPQKTAKKSTQESARDIVSTVSTWVTDFERRRRDETQQALEKFFTPQPQANNV
jgi:predicted RNA-binding protein